MKIHTTFGNVSLEQLERDFSELWPKRPSQEFLRVLAKVTNLLKSISRIVERITLIIAKRLKEQQRQKEKYILQGDLAEIQEYTDWLVVIKGQKRSKKKEKRSLSSCLI